MERQNIEDCIGSILGSPAKKPAKAMATGSSSTEG